MHEQFPQPAPDPSGGAELVQRIRAEVASYQPAADPALRRGDRMLDPEELPGNEHIAYALDTTAASPYRDEVARRVGPHPEGTDPTQTQAVRIAPGWGNAEALASHSHGTNYTVDGKPALFIVEDAADPDTPLARQVPEQPHLWRRPVNPLHRSANRVTSDMCTVGNIPAGAQSLTAPVVPPKRKAIPLRPATMDEKTTEMPLPPIPEAQAPRGAEEDTAEMRIVPSPDYGPYAQNPELTRTQPIPRLQQGWQETHHQQTYPNPGGGDTPYQGVPVFTPGAAAPAETPAAGTEFWEPYDALPDDPERSPILETLPVNEDEYVPPSRASHRRGHRATRRGHRLSPRQRQLVAGAIIASTVVGGVAYLGARSAGETTKDEALPERTYASTAPQVPEQDKQESTEKPKEKPRQSSPSAIPSLPLLAPPTASERPPLLPLPKKPEASASVTPEKPEASVSPLPRPTRPLPTETATDDPEPTPTPTPTVDPTPTPTASETATPTAEPTTPIIDVLTRPAVLGVEVAVQKPTRWERVRKASASFFSRLVSI